MLVLVLVFGSSSISSISRGTRINSSISRSISTRGIITIYALVILLVLVFVFVQVSVFAFALTLIVVRVFTCILLFPTS